MPEKTKKIGVWAAILTSFLVLFWGGWRPAESQAALTCTANAAAPPLTRWEGRAEKVGDLVLFCTGGTPGVPQTNNFQVFLNTPISSNLLDQNVPPTTEALLLWNDPAPVLQVLGFNVFQGIKGGSENTVIWPGVTFAPDSGGNVVFRIINLRANANALPSPNLLPSQIQALISVPGPSSLPINNPVQTVGFASRGSTFFTSDVLPGSFNLNFRENFATAFMKKIEVDASGDPIAQNIPGTIFPTESGFTTGFSLNDVTGRADTGTRLVARFKNLPDGTSLLVPTLVQSSNSALRARLLDKVNPDFTGGLPALSGSLPICQNTAHAVYEIEGAAGVTGAAVIDTFTIPVSALGPSGFGGAQVNGNLGPISTIGLMSREAPEPRFADLAPGAFPTPTCVTYLPLTIK